MSYTLNANFNFSSLEAKITHSLTGRRQLAQPSYEFEERNRPIFVLIQHINQSLYKRVIRQF